MPCLRIICKPMGKTHGILFSQVWKYLVILFHLGILVIFIFLRTILVTLANTTMNLLSDIELKLCYIINILGKMFLIFHESSTCLRILKFFLLFIIIIFFFLGKKFFLFNFFLFWLCVLISPILLSIWCIFHVSCYIF